MQQNKIFAGPRVRRLRTARDLTQTAMAQMLGISPSYLNLIERDQRPLTVQLLLRLAQTFSIDLAEWRTGDRAETVAELRRIFTEPLIAGELPGDSELVELADAAPNVAAALAKLHRAYKETSARLSDLATTLGAGSAVPAPASRMPLDEVRDTLEARPNHHAELEAAAEALRGELRDIGGDPTDALRRWLRERHDISVRILPADGMPVWRRRYDRHSRRLFLSERLDQAGRLREIAFEAARLGFGSTVVEVARAFGFSTDEAMRLAIRELTRYGASAVLMPYVQFHDAAVQLGFDVDRLARRFNASFADAAERLTALRRRSLPGPPFFFQESDRAGHVLRRAGAQGYPAGRFGGGCARLPQHRVEAGSVLAERAELSDGSRHLLVARAVAELTPDWPEPRRQTFVLLGCDWDAAAGTLYARRLAEAPALPIGPACRYCERDGCLSRAEPPLTRPLGLDEWVSGLTPFDPC